MLTPKFFRINTYETSRKWCKQITYRIVKSFKCNTYKKQGGGGYNEGYKPGTSLTE